MSLQTLFLALLVVLYGAAQYVLMFQALRDLARRPRVRGGNKVLWGIVILTVPIGGALLYSWMGPTSLLRRGAATSQRRARANPPVTLRGTNVTPIDAARGRRNRASTPRPDRTTETPSDARARAPLRTHDGEELGNGRATRTPRTGS